MVKTRHARINGSNKSLTSRERICFQWKVKRTINRNFKINSILVEIKRKFEQLELDIAEKDQKINELKCCLDELRRNFEIQQEKISFLQASNIDLEQKLNRLTTELTEKESQIQQKTIEKNNSIPVEHIFKEKSAEIMKTKMGSRENTAKLIENFQSLIRRFGKQSNLKLPLLKFIFEDTDIEFATAVTGLSIKTIYKARSRQSRALESNISYANRQVNSDSKKLYGANCGSNFACTKWQKLSTYSTH